MENHYHIPDITCPHCGKNFNPKDSLATILDGQAKAQAAEISRNLESKIRADIEGKTALEKKDLENQLAEQKAAAEKAREDSLLAMKKIRAAEDLQANTEAEIEKRTAAARAADKAIIEKQTKEKLDREIQTKQQEMESHYQQSLADDKQKMALMQKQLEDTQKKLEEAKRASHQISQQAQGEILELDFKRRLAEQFPNDNITDVAKGAEGADVVQEIYEKGRKAGTILWETKNTKNFSKEWVQKLKNDQRRLSAEVAVIATNTLPKDSPPIDQIDGVYVVSLAMALPLSMVLRQAVVRVAEVLVANEGQGDKAAQMYQYLISNAFKQKIEAIISAYQRLLSDTDKEERAMKKIWAERKKYLAMVVDSATLMYGDLQGIAGKEMPTIKELDLNDVPQLEE